MLKEDIKLGMKVVPISKSVGTNLEGSVHWDTANRNCQEYLYVSRIEKDYIACASVYLPDMGDYFLPKDLIPYVEECAK